jgi:4-amino-4-deoxy-L-arabinose transferase-like glycosyltransferase
MLWFFNRLITTAYGLSILTSFTILLVALPHVAEENHLDTNTFVHQAIAFLNGSTDISISVEDTIEVNGRYYLVFPPFPAIILMPFVFFFGTTTKTLLLTPVLGAITAYYAFHLALKNRVSEGVAGWATLGFLFGTSFLVCATFPIDTYFAHICAVMFTVVALHEAFGRQSGLLIGFALGFAFLSRQLTVLTIPFVWAVLFLVRPKEQQPYMAVRSVLTTCIGLACCAVLYGYFNWARFGDPLETGYDILSLSEPGWYGYRAQNWGNFHWVYIPSNLIRMFLSGFSMDFEGPGLMIPHMGSFGSSLTFASPVVFYAMYARNTRARGLTIAAWFSIGLTALAVLAHKSALGGYRFYAGFVYPDCVGYRANPRHWS